MCYIINVLQVYNYKKEKKRHLSDPLCPTIFFNIHLLEHLVFTEAYYKLFKFFHLSESQEIQIMLHDIATNLSRLGLDKFGSK